MSTCKFCDAEIIWVDRVPHNLDHSNHTCQRKQKKPPEPRDCKYECRTLLLWDDYRNAFKEVNTGEIHTIERCHTAKAKLAEKNNHGNEFIAHEITQPTIQTGHPLNAEYVDRTQGAKNNHGNEQTMGQKILEQEVNRQAGYVDHTLAGIPQIITIIATEAEELDDLVNSWLKKEHGRIRFKGGQRVVRQDGRYEITLYYEEIAK